MRNIHVIMYRNARGQLVTSIDAGTPTLSKARAKDRLKEMNKDPHDGYLVITCVPIFSVVQLREIEQWRKAKQKKKRQVNPNCRRCKKPKELSRPKSQLCRSCDHGGKR